MDIMEFDRFLRDRKAVELRYDSAAQPQRDPWKNEARFRLVFTQWDVYKSPNILVLKNGGNSMTLQAVRMITVRQTDCSGLQADIEYRGGIGGDSSLTVFIRTDIIN